MRAVPVRRQKVKTRSYVAFCGVVAVATLSLSSVAQAKLFRSSYPSHRVAAVNSGSGWTGSSDYDGLCVQSLTCPKVTNSTPSRHLRTQVGSLLGVGARSTGIWESRPFKYRGAQGRRPRHVLLLMDRRTRDDTFLGVAGNKAYFTVDVVAAKSGRVVSEPIHNAALTPRAAWTRVKAKVGRLALRNGHRYSLRVASTFQNGAQVIPGATADYDNVHVVARKFVRRRHHHHHR